MDRVADGFVWPLRDPEWLSKILIVALILLVPVAGAINGIGWMLATLDRLRAGQERLAPANFSHLGRGFRVFVVQLGYGVAVALVAAAVYVPGVLLASSEGSSAGANPLLIGASILVLLLALGVATLGSLAIFFATPAFILETERGGMAAGLNVAAVWRRSRANLTNTLVAGLMLIGASFISSLGVLVLIGFVFTAAYALAVQAWILHCYEIGSQALPDKAS